jgi:glycosyltransferase involved in cell wall biosynthesis
MLAHVGLNLLYLVPGQVGGTEIYARRLIDALGRAHPEAAFTAFCGREAAPVLRRTGWPANVRVQELPVDCAVKPLRIAAELSLLPAFAARAGVGLLHSMGTTTPLHGGPVRVVTVHDLIYDRYPGAFPWPARYGLKAVVPLGARRAHRVQADSQAGKDEIVERLGVPADRIDVVHLGLGMKQVEGFTDAGTLRSRWRLADGPVLVSVAAALPHKNLDGLLRAFAALQRPEAMLVLVGHAGRDTDRLRALAGQLGVDERVRFTGWVSDEDLEGVYRLARAFVYPSMHEGFGMPVLEAMARGVPVACADATSLPEVAGDAAVLFDPRSTGAMADAMRALLDDTDRAAALVQRGRARAARFGWERTAEAAWLSYGRALAGVRGAAA